MGSSRLMKASFWISAILFLVALQATSGGSDGGAPRRQKRQVFGSGSWSPDPYYSYYQRESSSPYFGSQWGGGGGRGGRGTGSGSGGSGWGWPGAYQPSGRHGRTTDDGVQTQEDAVESGRLLSSDSIATISETLGAINTVGRYLVNMTRNGGDGGLRPSLAPMRTEDLPGAIYTISKNVLGRNVTDTIAPYVRGAIPSLGKVVAPTSSSVPYQQHQQGATSNLPRPCKTPDGRTGNCDDLSDCPQLLLDFAGLRESICFKSLFSPGVCCPRPDSERPVAAITTTTTTRRPVIVTTTTRRPPPILTPAPTSAPQLFGPEDVSGLEDCGMTYGMSSFRIVGGSEALPARWPWMAAIFLHGPRRTEFWCGGTLVGKRHVLTAAHCTRDSRQRPFGARQFTVRLGDLDLKRDDELSAPETFGVTEVRAHPRFSRVGFYNDIAVLVLDRVVGGTGSLRRQDDPEAEEEEEDDPEGRKGNMEEEPTAGSEVSEDPNGETSTSSSPLSGEIKFIDDAKAIPLRFEDIEQEQDLGGERERLRRYGASAGAYEETEWRPMENFRRARKLWSGQRIEREPSSFVKFKRHAQKDEDGSTTVAPSSSEKPLSSKLEVLGDPTPSSDVTNRQGRAETGNSTQSRSNSTRTGGRAYGDVAFELTVGTGGGTVVYSPPVRIRPKSTTGSISRGRSLTSSNSTAAARTKRENADVEEEFDTLGGPYNRYLTLRPGKPSAGKTDPYLTKAKETKEKNDETKILDDEVTGESGATPNPEAELFSVEGRVDREEVPRGGAAVSGSEESEGREEGGKSGREQRMFKDDDMPGRNRRRAGFRGEGRGVSSRRWSRYIAPICLPSGRNREDNFVGERPTVVGWGTTYYGGKESTVQRQVDLPVWRNEDCNRSYFQPITSAFICAGLSEGGKDACQGDSGGPLMLKRGGRWIQIGVVSFGNKCGEAGYPGVYTRVTHYIDWIAQNTAD